MSITALVISNALLWVLVVGLALVVFALVRQVGLLHERVAPAGALALSGGPKIGETVPALRVATLDGESLSIGSPGSGAGTLLFFLSPTCPICRELVPLVQRVAADEARGVRVIYASDGGEPATHRQYRHDRGLDGQPYVLSTELGITYGVSKLPFAVLIDADGVLRARGLVNSREHLESLFEAQALGVGSLNEYIATRIAS